MFLCVSTFLSLVSLIAGNTPITLCGPGTSPDHVIIDTCTTDPCRFTRGSVLMMELGYNYPSRFERPYLSIDIRRYGIPITVFSINSCNYGPCPVEAGQTINYTVSQLLFNWFPKGNYQVTATLYGNPLTQLICAYINVVL